MKIILTILLLLMMCLLYSCSPTKKVEQRPKTMTIVKVKPPYAYARWGWEYYRGPIDTFKVGDRIYLLPGTGTEKKLFIRIH